jgi:hypothetical protein
MPNLGLYDSGLSFKGGRPLFMHKLDSFDRFLKIGTLILRCEFRVGTFNFILKQFMHILNFSNNFNILLERLDEHII